jgi:hypothetical protein
MRNKATLLLLAGLALLLAGCDFGGVVIGEIVTGPTATEEINVPVPSGDGPTEVVIGMGGGELDLGVGKTDSLVKGTVDYNVEEIRPSVLVEGGRVRIEQGDIEGKRIPIGNWQDVVNKWNLTLGTAPMELTVNAGAARARLAGLADLNASEITFNGGAGDFVLDFSGSLRQDMEVTVSAGAAQIDIAVPSGTAAELTFEGALTDIDRHGDWEKSGNKYVHKGTGPKITFLIKMGVGRLDLLNR